VEPNHGCDTIASACWRIYSKSYTHFAPWPAALTRSQNSKLCISCGLFTGLEAGSSLPFASTTLLPFPHEKKVEPSPFPITTSHSFFWKTYILNCSEPNVFLETGFGSNRLHASVSLETAALLATRH
jgi:hypothetical protein